MVCEAGCRNPYHLSTGIEGKTVASDYSKYGTKKILDNGPNDHISRLSLPEFPGKCYVKQAMSCAVLQKAGPT